MPIRKKIVLKGIVQGIGFRPYVYRSAKGKNLKGFVYNTEQGVIIEVEGEARAIEGFLEDLTSRPPTLAKITDLEVTDIPEKGDADFIIKESLEGIEPEVVIPPDLAICPDCCRELTDPADRRYLYPFINCTQCGPRLTIIRKVPYDRAHTSMSSFFMCEECEREFHDPLNRRFHAQPNGCPQCGPHVWLTDRHGEVMAQEEPVKAAARLIHQGAILAIKGLGGFHLSVDATNEKAVEELRRRKTREEKPLAIMSATLEKIREYAHLSDEDALLLQGQEHPILLIPKKLPNPIATSVAPNQGNFGVMLPYTPLHVILLREQFLALVMTSGNLSNEPIAIGNQEAVDTLSGIADYFLFHNRDILVRCDDSVAMPLKGRPYIVRRSRGYAPVPLPLKKSYTPVIALGGQMKNTLCVLRGNKAFISQHIGDLDTPKARAFFREALKRTQEIAGISPEIVAYDLHPDYYTTQYAQEMSNKILWPVQHHHAHLVSCMAENRLTGRSLGLIFDGTGYGPDGTIWGGEILAGDEVSFERVAHLSPFPLPGGEAAIQNPWRIGVGVLYQTYGEGWDREVAHLRHCLLPEKELSRIGSSLFNSMIKKGLNTPITSSMGRLFDAVASLLGYHHKVHYEGQAAIALEYIASLSKDAERYPLPIDQGSLPWKISIPPMIKAIIQDISRNVPRDTIARRFHNTLIGMAIEVVLLCCREFSITQVLLSGGCFQNRLLLEMALEGLKGKGLTPYIHHQVPTNDGCISLGQAVCAGAVYTREYQ